MKAYNRSVGALALLCGMTTGALALSSLPPQSERTQMTSMAQETDGLPPAIQSNPFILTTATTQWAAPGFSPTSVPCSSNNCPGTSGSTCIDSQGHTYGVICDQRLSGVAITSSGKHKREDDDNLEARSSEHKREADETRSGKFKREGDEDLETRSYTGSADLCATFCDQFDAQYCVGFGYAAGICTLYAAIQGTLQQSGSIGYVRQT